MRNRLEPLAIEANDAAVAGLSSTEQQELRRMLLTIIGNLERDEAEAASRGLRVPPTRASGEI
jgi:hypothetical protein